MKERIEAFNDKWRGQEVYFCELIGTALNFNPEELNFCCSSTTGRWPVAYNLTDMDYRTFSKSDYISSMMDIFEDIQNGCSACTGCERLVKIVFTGFDIEKIKIKHIMWNHFRGCNSHCIYCGDTKKFKKYYEPIEIVHNLDREGMIADTGSISFGGGEPTLLNNLKGYIEFGLERQWTQILNTSGLLNKEYIKDALLRDDKFSVQISVDSGTPETYFKIKGQRGFETVWNTIRDYCSTGKRVFVKYILFSFNSDKEEIDAFFEQCNRASVKNISVSAESSSNWKLCNDLQWEYGEKEKAATAYMLMKIVEAKHALFFYRGNLSVENYDAILDIFINRYLKSWMENREICIWGMGEYGKRLANVLEERDIKVRCFGDSDNTKCGTAYNQIKCLSLEQIKEESQKTNLCIFLAISYYEKIYSQLISEMPGTDIRVINIL